DFTVLHRLISRSFIEKNELRFDDSIAAHTDLSFFVPMMDLLEEKRYLDHVLYFRRKRNDPISNPSLSQQDTGFLIHDFMRAYRSMKEHEYASENFSEYLDLLFLNFYRKTIIL